jgi:hypothetical protein
MNTSKNDRIQCSKCERLVDRMVVMNCEHHICLDCAAKSFIMRKTTNQAHYRINCEMCGETTIM